MLINLKLINICNKSFNVGQFVQMPALALNLVRTNRLLKMTEGNNKLYFRVNKTLKRSKSLGRKQGLFSLTCVQSYQEYLERKDKVCRCSDSGTTTCENPSKKYHPPHPSYSFIPSFFLSLPVSSARPFVGHSWEMRPFVQEVSERKSRSRAQKWGEWGWKNGRMAWMGFSLPAKIRAPSELLGH